MADNNSLVRRLFRLTENGREEIDNPPLSKVMDAVRALNGKDFNTVGISLRNGDSMDVGGGEADQYKCHVRTKNSFYHLLNPACSRDMNEAVTIMMDDEGNAFPKCTIVSLEMVLAAVEHFCKSGELDPELTWDDTLEYDPL